MINVGPMSQSGWSLLDRTRTWESGAADSPMICRAALSGSVPLPELVVWLNEHVLDRPHVRVDPGGVTLNFATVTWPEPPTDEEVAARVEHERVRAERHAAWERETYARLRAKFKDEESDES